MLSFEGQGFIVPMKMWQNLSSIGEKIFKDKRMIAGKFSQLDSVF